jgi:hypothetical protein
MLMLEIVSDTVNKYVGVASSLSLAVSSYFAVCVIARTVIVYIN